jgi:hypothetical protein
MSKWTILHSYQGKINRLKRTEVGFRTSWIRNFHEIHQTYKHRLKIDRTRFLNQF